MTESLEDYLEMVSFLADDGPVRVTDIAARLGVSKPSVLSALKTLEERGLLEHERYGTVSLTPAGKAGAAEIRERHSLLTAFLTQVVGVNATVAEKEACKMEHLLSDETLQKMRSLIAGAARQEGGLPGARDAAPAKAGDPAEGRRTRRERRGGV